MGCQWKRVVCPKIEKVIENLKVDARTYDVEYAGNYIYKVRVGVRTFVTHLGNQTCTCRKWDLTGVPCSHAIAAIMKDKRDPTSFVHPFYHKETFMLSYESIINPIPDDSQWVHVELDAITAPPLRRPPGRPKKARRKASDEPKNAHLVRRTHQSLRCSKCQQYGHDTRTCKGAPVAPKKRSAVSGRGQSSTTRGQSARGRGRGTGRGRGRGRGKGTTPISQSQSSGITIATSMPTNGMTSVLVCVLSCTYHISYVLCLITYIKTCFVCKRTSRVVWAQMIREKELQLEI